MVLAEVQYMTLINERSHHSLDKIISVSALGSHTYEVADRQVPASL